MYKIAIIFFALAFAFSACQQPEIKQLKPGVSWQLARERFEDISEIDYRLELSVPDSVQGDIEGRSIISLHKKNIETPLIFDFVSSQNKVKAVKANGSKAFFTLENEHLVIPSRFLKKGNNQIEIEFVLGNGPLNRNRDYFYSLFVPARARTAIPCFDQPDLKVRFSVSIEMPKHLTAITNGKQMLEEEVVPNRKRTTYESSKPISSYLWAFAVGDFEKITQIRDNREISIFHMEKDSSKITRNAPAIFNQVFHSIQWLEDYSNVDFPFGKYDLVCIPSFQFAGMEHPGAVYYRAELLFLSENPTQNQLLRRAQLLAHETAHMWFGDLVTMKWFSGVWQKEVFANFIADKIVKEQFPGLNHDLTFLTSHFPKAYSVDRTTGANPIQQKLDNLNDAGSMYGRIIYDKAPIMMNQLEKLIGENALQKGLSKYLKDYSYKNASWADLINILNAYTEYNLLLWSDTWVNEAGRPVIEFKYEDEQLTIHQHPEYKDSSKVWAQQINYRTITNSKPISEETELLSNKTVLDMEAKPDFILPTINHAGYGLFLMDKKSLVYALNSLPFIQDELARAATLVQLYENFLHGNIHPAAYINMLQAEIGHEANEQVLTLACNQLSAIFWKFTDESLRNKINEELEKVLLAKIERSESVSIKKLLFTTYSEIVSSPIGLKELARIIKKGKIKESKLSEHELGSAVFQLTLKDNNLDETNIIEFAQHLKDEELKNKMLYASRVFASNPEAVDLFVENLKKQENRNKENWVLTSISYLHHPYLQEKNIRHLEGALELTETIKETGDIFFPIGWLNNTLYGYGSQEAEGIVKYFFKDHPQYPEDLQLKIVQAADMVSRSKKIKEKYLN